MSTPSTPIPCIQVNCPDASVWPSGIQPLNATNVYCSPNQYKISSKPLYCAVWNDTWNTTGQQIDYGVFASSKEEALQTIQKTQASAFNSLNYCEQGTNNQGEKFYTCGYTAYLPTANVLDTGPFAYLYTKQ